jgi:hypothetical protein
MTVQYNEDKTMLAASHTRQQSVDARPIAARLMTMPQISKHIPMIRSVALVGGLLAALATSGVRADTLSVGVEVNGNPSDVWATIGPFCAIKNWLPPVGTCAESGSQLATRTLVTKDGKATFIETQTMRDDAAHTYSYTFQSSPLPVSSYASTLKVSALKPGRSLVTWTGIYVPAPGKEKDAIEALSGIYAAGIASIKSKFGS